jgi:hypothetical protein
MEAPWKIGIVRCDSGSEGALAASLHLKPLCSGLVEVCGGMLSEGLYGAEASVGFDIVNQDELGL